MTLQKYSGREGSGSFAKLTLREVKALDYGQTVWIVCKDGSARRAKVNGCIKRWKREPNRVRVPLKYGLYEYFSVEFPRPTEVLLKEVLRQNNP